jgi:hypothetical protein
VSAMAIFNRLTLPPPYGSGHEIRQNKKKPQRRCQGPCTKLGLPSGCVKVTRRGLAGSFVGNDFVGDFLTFLQIAQS